jgi:hypothetical protein
MFSGLELTHNTVAKLDSVEKVHSMMLLMSFFDRHITEVVLILSIFHCLFVPGCDRRVIEWTKWLAVSSSAEA